MRIAQDHGMVEDFLNSPWSEALQYVLIFLAAVLPPSLSAFFRYLERARDRMEMGNRRIVLEQYQFPMLITFQPEQTDEPYTVTLKSRSRGLLLARPGNVRSQPKDQLAEAPRRKLADLPMNRLLGGNRNVVHLGASFAAVGEPGAVLVVVRNSRRVLARRIITIQKPARAPLPIQDTPGHQGETNQPSA